MTNPSPVIDMQAPTPGPSPLAPAEELGVLVGWASVLFHAAEEGVNPSVTSIWDAYHYIATSLSVGYANIFPVTAMGRAIGAVVMTVGPAMSARALEGPRPTASSDDSSAIVAKLDEILVALRKRDEHHERDKPEGEPRA